MAKDKNGKKITLIGGNKAAKVNPLGLRRQFKAVCVTHKQVLSPQWRDSKEEALGDVGSHTGPLHFIDFNIKVT